MKLMPLASGDRFHKASIPHTFQPRSSLFRPAFDMDYSSAVQGPSISGQSGGGLAVVVSRIPSASWASARGVLFYLLVFFMSNELLTDDFGGHTSPPVLG
jgi:hypothetical protein